MKFQQTLNEFRAADPEDVHPSQLETVGAILDLIQEIQGEEDSSDIKSRIKNVGIEFFKIAMGEIPIVGGALGAADGLFAMYQAGKNEERTWAELEEYPILNRIKMHPDLAKHLDPVTLREVDKAYIDYLKTLGRETLVKNIKDIDVFTRDWVKDDTDGQISIGLVREHIRKILKEELQQPVKVLGYLKPTESFFTLAEWEYFAVRMIELQNSGFDTRSGEISCKNAKFCNTEDYNEFVSLIVQYFGFQMNTEVQRYDLLTYKNILDFIEDFVNHRFWGLENEFDHYFHDITKLKFAYFYSRGDIEPYALIDEEFTAQLYGTTWNPKKLSHYTSAKGIVRLQAAIEQGLQFDISSFTVAERPFFREDSNHIVEFMGNVRAGFRSDVKSFATTSGRRAVNLYRLEYPGKDTNNICYELESCDGSVRTSLWNEYIATPIEILGVNKIVKESIDLDVEVGDIVLTGKFKNKRTVVKSIGKDEYGHPTINGKSILKFKIEKQLPKKKWSAKSREEELSEGLLREGAEFRTLDSPLKYARAGNVKRIAYCDSSVTEPPSQRDQYFKEWEKWRKYSKGGKRLKKPKLEEIVPGVSDVCIIGFLDYHQATKNSDGSTYWYIDYMKTRGDSQGRGVASKLMDQFYETVAQPGDNVHFGKMMREEIGHLKDKMAEKYPEIDTIGAVYY
jgi:hypothetical protein